MQTIKTIVVVAVLLGIGYGVYVVLNPPPTTEPEELAGADPDLWSKPPEVELNLPGPGSSPAASPPPVLGSADHGDDHGDDHDHAAGHGTMPTAPQPLATYGGSEDSTPGPMPSSPYGETSPSAYGGSSPATASASTPSVYGGGASAPSAYGASPEVAPSAYAGALDRPGLPAAPGSGEISPIADGFTTAWRSAQSQLAEGELDLALFTLSQLYGKPERTPDQNAQLVPLLDQLAGTVIYSREHYLEGPYTVLAGTTLEQIAAEYRVSADFLARVNGLDPAYPLQPGQELKVVRGPFRAEIDSQGQEMTLFLNRYYAGRFPVAIGSQAAGQTGMFQVTEKARQRTDYSSGQPIAPGQPGNPFGQYWIGLGGNLGLHGAAATALPGDGQGSLRLAPQDAADVFLILADGSEVTIR